MLEKIINELMFDNYSNEVEDIYDDLLNHPESDTRKEELLLLMDQVYRTGFHDGLRFMEWLTQY